MPDQTAEIDRLRRQLVREERARLEAETLLEAKSAALFAALQRLESEAEQGRALLTALTAAQDGLAVANADGQFIFMNTTHETMFGYGPGELLGESWRRLYSKEELERFDRDIFPEFAAKGRFRGEATGQTKTGEDVVQEIVLTSLADGGLVCSTRDISDRKAREQAARALDDYIRDAEKDAALLTLSSSIAHDFNNLLFAMNGHLRLLAPLVPPGSEAASLVGRLTDSARSAADIVAVLNRFRTDELSDFTGLDLVTLVRQTRDIADPLRPERATIKLDLPEEAIAPANAALLSRCLINLLKNAFEASPAGGEVTVRLSTSKPEKLHPDADTRQLGRETRPSHWYLEIEDRGHGMSLADMEEVFHPFFSTKSGQEGSGLGLSSLVFLVETSPVCAEVQSVVGHGTRFTLAFPALDAEPRRIERSTLTSTRRIVLVDDEVFVGELIQRSLEELGHDVTYFSRAEDALRAISEPATGFEVLMTDLNMPGMRGEEVARKAIQVNPNLICIGFSGQADFLQPDPVFSTVLRKPLDTDDLDDAIHSATARDHQA